MIHPNIHPRTLPFDIIARTNYSIFNNHIFRQMSNHIDDLEDNNISSHFPPDPHYQDTIGDQLTEKPRNTFRVLGQNINGISPKHEFNKWKEILQSTISQQIDVLCLSETNVEWRHPITSTRIPAITKRFFNQSRLITSSSAVKFQRIFKPGGTATLITNEWTGRILTCEQDSSGLGRWTTTKMTGKRHKKIAIITAYQVCKTSIHQSGITTCYTQQWHLLRAQGEDLPDPRNRFWTDLSRHIQELQTNQFQIILMGDFNTTFTTDNRNPLNILQRNCQLSNAVGEFHECSQHTSYARGTQIIDYCLVSTNLLPSIRACGYLPLHFLCFSDHRGIYVDFDSSILFGNSPPKIAKPMTRYVKSRDARATSKFLTRLNAYWSDHSIRSRISRLSATLERTKATASVRRYAMKIDRDRTRGFLMAEKTCHRRDRPPWSRTLHRLSRQFRYWQIVISDFRLKRQSYNALIGIQDELKWRPEYHPTSLHDARNLLNDTKTALKAIRQQAETYRSKDLQQQAQEADLAGDHLQAKRLRRLHQAETTHNAFLKIRRYLKPKHSGGITKLEIPINQPDGSTKFELSEDPQLIEEACLTRNQTHFGQAQGTPFTIPPLSLIESSACGPVTDAILEGRLDDLPFDVTELPEEQRIILEELEQCCPTMADTISFEDFKRRFEVWNEDTSTSPSGMYLGLYKALISSKYNKDLVDADLLQEGEDIFMDIFILSNAACRFGFAYDRWKEIVNCMINKKTDSFLLNQLRVIHLFEADYNLIIGLIFGRYMIHRLCDNDLFHPSQWGRPNRECEDVLMLKELTYQVANMSRTDLATFDNDASACYDRIVTRFALLCCRAHGVPEGPCRMTAEVLDNVIHKIKTAYGISKKSYVNEPEHPIHGVGQGSQDGPSLWGVSSSTTFHAADRLSQGLTCINPCHAIHRRSITHSRKLDGFIDDVTGWFNRMAQELRQQGLDIKSLAQGMQQDAATWQKLLNISGGKLAVTKCLYYLGHWRWLKDGTPELTPASEIGNLITLNDDSGPITIPHYDSSEAHLTLGVWKSLSGNLTKQHDHLMDKSHKWTKSMVAANLTRDEAFLSFTRIYIPSLRYGLGTCFFPEPDLLRIQRPAVNAILPKMGYNCHFPRAVVYGSRTSGGLGLPSLVYEQGLQHIQFIGRHLRSPTSPLRPLFQIGIEWFRMLSGYTTCPLSSPQLSTSHVEHALWFKSLQKFLATINHSLLIPNLYCPRKLREYDQAIMHLSHESFTDNDLLQINRCRLYLQVHMVSEICSADGSGLLPSIWRGTHPTNSSSKLFWPRQQRPSGIAWRLWRRFLTPLLKPTSYSIYSTRLPLAQPLGHWFDYYQDERQWNWYYTAALKSLIRFDTMARSFQVHPTTYHLHRLQADIDPDDCWYALPTDAIPCDPKISTDTVSLPARFVHAKPSHSAYRRLPCPYTDRILPTPNTPAHSTAPVGTWSQYMQQWSQWETSLLPTSLDLGVIEYVRTAQQHQSTIYHCSDGSAQDSTGSFGWAFGPNTQVMLRHAGPAFGSPMDSYLAESYGLLSSSCFWFRLTKLVLHRRLPRFKIKLYCDNKSLIRRVNEFLQFFDGSFRRSLTPNYDVVYLISCVLRLFPPGVVEVLHVKGHQDSIQPRHNLPWPAQLNVIADSEATTYIRVHPHSSLVTPFLPSAQIHLRNSHHEIIIKRWNLHLRSEFYRRPYEAWLSRQFHWDPDTLRDVDFRGLSMTLRCLPSYLLRFISKWINQGLPTRRRVHRYDKNVPPTCKSCPTVEECDHHFLLCPSDLRRSACTDLYTTVQLQLYQLHTKPTLADTILHLLRIALGFPSCPVSSVTLQSQTRIGNPILFLKGRWSKLFRIQQEQFYREQHRPVTLTGDRWMRQILSTLFQQLHQVWKCRNSQTHGADLTLQDSIRREQLTIRVQALYNQIPNLLAHDKYAFESISQEDLLSGPTSGIATWLQMAEPTMQRCLRDANIKLHTNQRDIRDYFDEASYIDSEASDTSLSFDTMTLSETISFQPNSLSPSDSSDSSISSTESSGTWYSGTDQSQ